ncbi:MAG: exo-alpha-sialidase, partial [Proteiniphilum sp.]
MNVFLKTKLWLLLSLLLPACATSSTLMVDVQRPTIPVLTLKRINPTIRIDVRNPNGKPYTIRQMELSLEGTTQPDDIISIGLYGTGKDGMIDTSRVIYPMVSRTLTLPLNYQVDNMGETTSLWVAVMLKDEVTLSNRINIQCRSISSSAGNYRSKEAELTTPQRVGVALRQAYKDDVAVSRIPGLATSKEGTLFAIFDARWNSGRDLQGDMDIALHRSFDKGKTWQPMQVILDMKQWGGLPEKFNGVSDASILVDENSGTLFVAGLWMHGILDKESGKWIEGLDEQSDAWIHQWHDKGSQPGYGVRQTSQFLITQSTDNGDTWSEPINITSSKREEWWLFAPAPGHGITMSDGTLVFPTQGRDSNGLPFSNITWSRDGGKTWRASNPAYDDVTECMVVELTDGSLMLNMRDNRNRNNKTENGRR